MDFLIDKHGGSHYHLKGCRMTKDPKFHYEPVKRRVKIGSVIAYPNYIVADKKRYIPCACILTKSNKDGNVSDE